MDNEGERTESMHSMQEGSGAGRVGAEPLPCEFWAEVYA